MAAVTEFQRAAGIQDDPRPSYHEYMFINQFEVQPGIARRLAGDSGAVIAWLTELGAHCRPTSKRGDRSSVCRAPRTPGRWAAPGRRPLSGVLAIRMSTSRSAAGWTASSCAKNAVSGVGP